MKLFALSGSARAASTNTALLAALQRHAPCGIEIEIYRDLEKLPIFNPDREGALTPARVLDLAARLDAADGLVVACPEYAHGIPGGLKNALDWLVSRFEIPHKPTMIAHASHRGDLVLGALREVLTAMSVDPVEEAFIRIPLIGKAPGEVEAMLDGTESRAAMRHALETFRSAAADRRNIRQPPSGEGASSEAPRRT